MRILGAGLVLWCVALVAACECRPVPPNDWRDLGIRCNLSSDLASTGSDTFTFDNQADFVNFLQRDCLRGQSSIQVPKIDWGREVVVIDIAESPLPDERCVQDRTVAQVDVCRGGLQILFDDVEDPECGARKLTGSVAVGRQHVRAATANNP